MACHVDLIVGDVADPDAVGKAYEQVARPVGDVIQGAMVLRVSTLSYTHFQKEEIDLKSRICLSN